MRESTVSPSASSEGWPEGTGIKKASTEGANLFIRISVQRFASVAKQGTAIALEYRNQPDRIRTLGTSLLSDPDEILRAVKAANKKHARHKVRPVSRAKVVKIIEAVFRQAARLCELPEEALEKILAYESELKHATSAEMDRRGYAERIFEEYKQAEQK